MRYEKPECVLLGEAGAVVLGLIPSPTPENNVTDPRPGLIGYDL
jgi:hypothetical protein